LNQVSRTTIDHSGIYEQEEQMQTQELTMTGRAVQELSTFNSLIETVIPYGDLTVAEDGIGKVEEAHKAVKRLSASIEKKRKELKADALEYGRTVDSIAKQLTEKVDGVESKLKAEREAFDAVEKAEKAAKEAAKQAAKQARINEMVANGIAID
jgi:type IV secretory pathway TrbL component